MNNLSGDTTSDVQARIPRQASSFLIRPTYLVTELWHPLFIGRGVYSVALAILKGVLDMGTFDLEVKPVSLAGNLIVSWKYSFFFFFLVFTNNLFYSLLGPDHE